uniref:uncharacterized protein n=1 Tax=Myxine glutinosa TaxID=7769 RepID=UPI00358F2A4C
MALGALWQRSRGFCVVKLGANDVTYSDVKLMVLQNLCSEVLLGHDFLNRHKRREMQLSGAHTLSVGAAPGSVCSLAEMAIDPPPLFPSLTPNCHPVTIKSRRYSQANAQFIADETKRLLLEVVIESSCSPWRAQVQVINSANHRECMVVDYSQTINHFTQPDAYPLPRMDDMWLYQFRIIPFGVTNGVVCFQQAIDDYLSKEQLKDVFGYVNNVTVCGWNQKDHDANLRHFLEVARKYHLTFNEAKSQTSFQQLKDDIAGAVVTSIDKTVPFLVETDASDCTIAATLNQGGGGGGDRWHSSHEPYQIVRVTAFLSREIKQFLLEQGIASSRTTAYNPQGNGLIERYNGIIWRVVTMALRTRGMTSNMWEHVLLEALHAIRSLLCTATNATPHERLFKYQHCSSIG